ncbi:PHP domain-containing protein [Dermacoccus nishinomiyaensis]|uniref:PHP domain-containing protein n=1 Tax=Dermacoccus nishinomiyaensis TaxID=1274 RepID=UPI0013F3B713|nr:PHP domain-containing protein [Dermacoccus nishinomiyaensis]MCG7430293.1 PHP domain-containing protein [Dermacoccus nishinomiyaensis]MCI0154275.1 PHP domain-containing protein [Dermacoccus nishinomiyaensis]NHC32348.1 PHP domain-containing protein [Dermacoccus nishinomiyaensis]
MRIDLHTHSNRSDGTTSPADVVAEASEAGLDVVALTDHDTTRGWDDAADAARRVGIDVVRGIEISCRHRGISIHLLAYLPAPEGELFDEMERARESRVTRAERMVERLGRDVPITYEQVLAQAGPDATIGRPHIADALVANGVVPDRSTAFEHLLSNSGPYHVGHYAIDPVRAVTLVRAAGGVPVMAHPFADVRGRVVDDAVIEEMIDAGLLGLEAHHRDHTPEQVRHARDLARTHDLLVTGSSDYHGDGKPNRLGENTTEPDQYERLVALATSDVGVVRGR